MNQDNEYSEVEKQIDEILSDGEVRFLPPGFWTFALVNLLLIIGVVALTTIAEDVLIDDQIPEAALFGFISSIVLTFVIVTPAFLVIRGHRKAVVALKYIIITLIIVLTILGVLSGIESSLSKKALGLGLASLFSSLWLLNSSSYLLLSLFTTRRREIAQKYKQKRPDSVS